jgi:hypothetical protein
MICIRFRIEIFAWIRIRKRQCGSETLHSTRIILVCKGIDSFRRRSKRTVPIMYLDPDLWREPVRRLWIQLMHIRVYLLYSSLCWETRKLNISGMS